MFFQKILAWLLVVRLFFAAGFFLPGNQSRAEAIAQDETASAGYSLTQLLLEKCYDPLGHNMHKHTDDKGLTYAWGAASFLEAMADAYRLFPTDLRLRYDYNDALKRCIPHYLAKDQTIETPSGPVSGITYYNASAGNRGDYYYDDNAWICIQLLFGYQNLGDKSLLDAAKTARTKTTAAAKKTTTTAAKTTAAKKTMTAAKKTTTTAKKTTSAAKKTTSAAKTTTAAKKDEYTLTATEKKLIDAYRSASSENKKLALNLLQGKAVEESDGLNVGSILQNGLSSGLGGVLETLISGLGK